MVGAVRCTMRLKRPAASIARVLRPLGGVSTHSSPPGLYWYQMGTVSGARSGRSVTDSAPMWGSARNCSRSAAESAMRRTLPRTTDKNSRVEECEHLVDRPQPRRQALFVVVPEICLQDRAIGRNPVR